jgi:hypothetical protein
VGLALKTFRRCLGYFSSINRTCVCVCLCACVTPREQKDCCKSKTAAHRDCPPSSHLWLLLYNHATCLHFPVHISSFPCKTNRKGPGHQMSPSYYHPMEYTVTDGVHERPPQSIPVHCALGKACSSLSSSCEPLTGHSLIGTLQTTDRGRSILNSLTGLTALQ